MLRLHETRVPSCARSYAAHRFFFSSCTLSRAVITSYCCRDCVCARALSTDVLYGARRGMKKLKRIIQAVRERGIQLYFVMRRAWEIQLFGKCERNFFVHLNKVRVAAAAAAVATYVSKLSLGGERVILLTKNCNIYICAERERRFYDEKARKTFS